MGKAKSARIVITMPEDIRHNFILAINIGLLCHTIDEIFHRGGFPEDKCCTQEVRENKCYIYFPLEKTELKNEYEIDTYYECLEEISGRIREYECS